MARLYANENFPLPVVDALRERGHDVLTTTEAEMHGQALPDAEVLAFAIADARAVLTLNRKHFIRLHAEQPEHCGIIVCTFDSDFPGQAERIHEAIVAVLRLTVDCFESIDRRDSSPHEVQLLWLEDAAPL